MDNKFIIQGRGSYVSISMEGGVALGDSSRVLALAVMTE